MAGSEMSNGAASSFTVAGPWLSLARIARRVGSARAAKRLGKGVGWLGHLAIMLINMIAKYGEDRLTRQPRFEGKSLERFRSAIFGYKPRTSECGAVW
jgi:hypothetical protein